VKGVEFFGQSGGGVIFKSTNQSVVWLKRPVVWLVIKLIDTRESVKVLVFLLTMVGG